MRQAKGYIMRIKHRLLRRCGRCTLRVPLSILTFNNKAWQLQYHKETLIQDCSQGASCKKGTGVPAAHLG